MLDEVTVKCPECDHVYTTKNRLGREGEPTMLICPECGFNDVVHAGSSTAMLIGRRVVKSSDVRRLCDKVEHVVTLLYESVASGDLNGTDEVLRFSHSRDSCLMTIGTVIAPIKNYMDHESFVDVIGFISSYFTKPEIVPADDLFDYVIDRIKFDGKVELMEDME